MVYEIAADPFGSDDTTASQDHQEGYILVSSDTGTLESTTLQPPIGSFESEVSPALSSIQKPWSRIFPQNVHPPALYVTLPPPGVRFDSTAQLAYCGNLLRKYVTPSLAATNTLSETLDSAQQALIESYAQNEDEGNRVRLLIQMVVKEFVADNLKTTAVLSEVLLLAPSLDQEYYRKLLNCVIAEFENARLLDVTLLRGLVQLVEGSSPDYLESDDLVHILTIIRSHWLDTHRQSMRIPYYLTWAISRLLDVMVEGRVKDLRSVKELLSALLNQLKESEDPYLKHQAIYAFQGLLHIPNDEPRRQYILRYTDNISMGLLGVASVCILDLGEIKDEVDHLYEAAGEAHKGSVKIADGAQSSIESSQEIWASVKGGIFSGGRQLWYTSLREAQQHIRNGRLQDFNKLVSEAPCRNHINFQWGICLLLGDIAIDPLWEAITRQQAIDFLAELHWDGSMWTPNKDIYRWILDILRMIVAMEDTVISDHAVSALQSLAYAGDAAKQMLYRDTLAGPLCSYLIQGRPPFPTSSILLPRALADSRLEYKLLALRDRRLREPENALFIPPQAKSPLKSDTFFPLMERTLEFLASPSQVFLLLGDSGSGKSTFSLQLERALWNSYKNGGPIPLHINLPSVNNPQQDMIVEQLRQLHFGHTHIVELKQNRDFIVICDGYDESQLKSNIHETNHFNQHGQWRVKMIVTCRTQYLDSGYRDLFAPQGNSTYDRPPSELFQEAVIAPFTVKQIKRYIDIYVSLEPRAWSTQDYMYRLSTIPGLMGVVTNTFLLTLALEALPNITASTKDPSMIKLSRVQLYDSFVQNNLYANQRRLERSSMLSNEDRQALDELLDAGFVLLGIDYSTRLAQAIFDNNNGNPVVQYVHSIDKNTWKAMLFGSRAAVRLLRDSSPLTRTGNQYRFIHRSMLEYFFSLAIYNPKRDDDEFDLQVETMPAVSEFFRAPFSQRSLLQEPSVIDFLCDRVKMNPAFKDQLRDVIDKSKTDAGAAVAAANAITILVRAGVYFNSTDLRGIKIPGADLSNGQFDSAQFQGADLTGVNLSKSWLRHADLSDTNMEGVRFGEQPYLEMNEAAYSCTFSPDGKLLGVALYNGTIYIYNASAWTRKHRLDGHVKAASSVVFSSDSQRLVSGGHDKTVRLWDTAFGEELLVMKGHGGIVNSVTISRYCNRIASASHDKTVRLWDAQTGESLCVLDGHTSWVRSVKYSPDGLQLVSCSWDRTIRFWDAKTGEPGLVLSPSSGIVNCVAYSPNGRWVAAGHEKGRLQLWDAVSLKPGPILSGHTKHITAVDFSLDGRLIASSSEDQTVRLWDASTGALITVLAGHNNCVHSISFSPSGDQIASGGHDCKVRRWEVRLWEADSSRPGIDSQDDDRVEGLAYTLDGQSILSYGGGGISRQWEAETGIPTVITHEPPVQTQVAFKSHALDDSQPVLRFDSRSFPLRGCQTSTVRFILEKHSKRILMLVYSPCRRWMVSVDEMNTLHMWDLHDVDPQPLVIDADGSLDGDVSALAFSSTGNQIAISAWSSICIFETQSIVYLGRVELEEDILSLVYSSNNQELAIGTEEGRIYLWDLQSKEPGVILERHPGPVRCVAYSPCGQWIASGSDDKSVGIWHRQLSGETESWSRVHSICAFFGYVSNVAWNPVVPMEFVTSSFDGSIRVWRIMVDIHGKITVMMAWGSNLGILCFEGITFANAKGLSPIHKKLLVQGGAVLFSGQPTLIS